MTIVFGKIGGGKRRKIFEGRKEKTMGSNFVQENQPYPPFGRLPRLGRLIPLICFAKGKQANQPSAEEMLFPPGIFILTALLSAAFAAPFLAEAGFKRNKEKISNLICLKPFLIPSLPYALPFQGKVKTGLRP
ncbi:MAG: hypothetical protein LKE16_07745 [Dialister sp.]|jgi:hypothetical protein|uniref:hypothetical protein n=1 Tax=Dialister hominis TaxID=2582419 RepID=UPI00300EA5A7|nr:hypothetical protein [Dialister sp.]HJI41826.1 hypothetical protein [Veillonellaceae bacterium]